MSFILFFFFRTVSLPGPPGHPFPSPFPTQPFDASGHLQSPRDTCLHGHTNAHCNAEYMSPLLSSRYTVSASSSWNKREGGGVCVWWRGGLEGQGALVASFHAFDSLIVYFEHAALESIPSLAAILGLQEHCGFLPCLPLCPPAPPHPHNSPCHTRLEETDWRGGKGGSGHWAVLRR
jgi:hypothetical protein